MADTATQTRRTRREVLSEWRHKEVLEAARRIFAKLGYEAANVEEIAKEAGMAKGTVYLYFKSKEEVFAAVLGNDLEDLTNRTIEAMAGMATFADRLKVFFDLRLSYLQHNQDFLRIYFAEFGIRASRPALISEVIERKFQRTHEFMCRCLEEAILQGELRAVPVDATARAIFDLGRGFAERHLLGWRNLSFEEDAEFMRSMILNGLTK